jgi:hypothetical protein
MLKVTFNINKHLFAREHRRGKPNREARVSVDRAAAGEPGRGRVQSAGRDAAVRSIVMSGEPS